MFSCFDLLLLLVLEFMLKFANLLIAILGMLLAWHCQMPVIFLQVVLFVVLELTLVLLYLPVAAVLV